MAHQNSPSNSSDSFSSYEEIPEYNISSEESDLEDEDSTVVNILAKSKQISSDNNSQSMNRAASYDIAFSEAGFGLWQFLLLAQCGWANASDAIEIMCVSFIIPALKSDMNLSSLDLSGLSISVFLGMMVGGYLWGVMADSIGRRRVIMMSLTVNALFAIASAFATSYPMILTFRLISGIGVGGSLPVCFSYFTEFQPTSHRGSMISALATCWMAGNVLVAGIAWVVMAGNSATNISPYGQSWRLFIIVCTLPSLSSALLFYKMPESPKFLYEKGRYEESLKVLKKIFYWNQYLKKRKRIFNIEEIEPEESEGNFETDYLLPTVSARSSSTYRNRRSIAHLIKVLLKKLKRILFAFWGQIEVIFSRREGRIISSSFLSVINLTLSFGSYGLVMWLPVLMERTEQSGHSPCREKSIQTPNSSSQNSSNPDDGMYFDVFVGVAAQLPANILTILLMDHVGGKIFLIFSMGASGISVLFFGLLNTRIQILVMSALFNAVSTMAWNALDVISMEMFTTDVRSSALGFFTGLCRIGSIMGNLLFGYFMDMNCSVPIFTVSIGFFIGCISTLFIPNTRQIHLR